jgi:hypothetical protein
VVTGFAKSLFNNINDGDLDERVVEMVQDLEVVQTMRSELTTTKCSFMQVDEKDRMGKKQVFTVQSNQNCVDSD